MAQAQVTSIIKDTQVEAARVPPQSIEAEQSVLGGLLLDNSAWDRIADLVGEHDFYRADHRDLPKPTTGRRRYEIRYHVHTFLVRDRPTPIPGSHHPGGARPTHP